MSALVRAGLLARARSIAGLACGAALLVAVFAASYGAVPHAVLGGPGHAPRYMAAFAGTADADLTTPRGWMAFAFNHPMFLALTLGVAITIGCAAIAGEVESRRAELLFTRPRARRSFLLAALAVWLVCELAVLLVATAAAIGSAELSSSLRHGGMAALVRAPLQLLPLSALVVAIAVLASASCATRGRAVAVTVAVVVGGYLLNLVALLVGGLDALRWASPFNYYDPVGAVGGGLHPGHAALLLGAAAALLVAADRRLAGRDLA